MFISSNNNSFVYSILTGDEEKQKVLNAMRYIESKTCVKFVARTTQEDYIIINKEANAGRCV